MKVAPATSSDRLRFSQIISSVGTWVGVRARVRVRVRVGVRVGVGVRSRGYRHEVTYEVLVAHDGERDEHVGHAQHLGRGLGSGLAPTLVSAWHALTTYYLLLTTHDLQLTWRRIPPALSTYYSYSLLTTRLEHYYLLLTSAHYLLLTTYYSLLTWSRMPPALPTHYFLPTTHDSPLTGAGCHQRLLPPTTDY
eukprot:scaffold54413_cov35-Phaeocystis_antarctica.AAC.2